MYSNKPATPPSNSDVQKAATFCGVSPQHKDATGGNISIGIVMLLTISYVNDYV